MAIKMNYGTYMAMENNRRKVYPTEYEKQKARERKEEREELAKIRKLSADLKRQLKEKLPVAGMTKSVFPEDFDEFLEGNGLSPYYFTEKDYGIAKRYYDRMYQKAPFE